MIAWLRATLTATALLVAGQGAGAGFVTVADGDFVLDGRPFHFAGANCYYLMVFAAEPELRVHVNEVLRDAQEMGLTVIRTWAFNDGDGWNALQTVPGVYDERIFEGLDYVLHRCDQLGLRVILPLVNNWGDYGGMDQYVAWSQTATVHDDFYSDASTRLWYRDHARAMIERVNSINGRAYRDDPTILAWELANEPRCLTDRSGATLQAWIEEMAAFIADLDRNHLVTTGVEGFFADSGGPWYLDGSQGADFTANHAVEGIDFATAHSWPEHWGLSTGGALDLVRRQADAAVALGKPLVLEEYGLSRDGGRDAFFAEVHALALERRLGGTGLWILCHDDYPDYDGFCVYAPEDDATITLLETHARAMRALSHPPRPPRRAGGRLGR